MDEDQLYVTAPPQSPPRRVPADAIAGEWLAERLASFRPGKRCIE
jgi:hypothetical protein